MLGLQTISNGQSGLGLSSSPSGGFGGGQIGYNWQGILHPHLVLGIEADFEGAGISDSKSYADLPYSRVSAKTEIDWFGTVRGRIGYAFDRTLVYGTGRLCLRRSEKLLCRDDGKFVFQCLPHETQTGWVVGGGVEHKLTPAWSVKAEYQYINLGKDDFYYNLGATDSSHGCRDSHCARRYKLPFRLWHRASEVVSGSIEL